LESLIGFHEVFEGSIIHTIDDVVHAPVIMAHVKVPNDQMIPSSYPHDGERGNDGFVDGMAALLSTSGIVAPASSFVDIYIGWAIEVIGIGF
jgi:hypothetical protein